jgi:hypothetical protein
MATAVSSWHQWCERNGGKEKRTHLKLHNVGKWNGEGNVSVARCAGGFGRRRAPGRLLGSRERAPRAWALGRCRHGECRGARMHGCTVGDLLGGAGEGGWAALARRLRPGARDRESRGGGERKGREER